VRSDDLIVRMGGDESVAAVISGRAIRTRGPAGTAVV
jgi:hypothetical protein